jgi:hypothetical protein
VVVAGASTMSVEQLAGFLNRPLEGAMIRGSSLRATMIAADLLPDVFGSSRWNAGPIVRLSRVRDCIVLDS